MLNTEHTTQFKRDWLRGVTSLFPFKRLVMVTTQRHCEPRALCGVWQSKRLKMDRHGQALRGLAMTGAE